jgi:hypothetical protein
MGRGVIIVSPEAFMDLFRGGRLEIWYDEAAVELEPPLDGDASSWTLVRLITTYVRRDVDLRDVSLVCVEEDPGCNTVEITVCGEGLPAWTWGTCPQTLNVVVHPPPALRAPTTVSRRLDLEDGP